jgi:hypothetical protein
MLIFMQLVLYEQKSSLAGRHFVCGRDVLAWRLPKREICQV